MTYGRRGRGWFMDQSSPLSVLEIVKSGTLDLRLASLLWVIMERRASVLVAAGPSQAGKSTTLNMLLDFMRPEIKRIDLQGDDDFSFLKSTKPDNTYLVAAEFSDFGDYVWGDVALKAFELLTQGYGLGGTIHAQTDEEVVGILNEYLGLTWQTLAHIDAIVTLFVARGRSYDAEPIRRINSVSLLIPRKAGLSLATLARLGPNGNDIDIAGEKELQIALSARLDIKDVSVAQEMAEREQFLRRLMDEGKLSRDEVRKAVVEFYKSHPA